MHMKESWKTALAEMSWNGGMEHGKCIGDCKAEGTGGRDGSENKAKTESEKEGEHA